MGGDFADNRRTFFRQCRAVSFHDRLGVGRLLAFGLVQQFAKTLFTEHLHAFRGERSILRNACRFAQDMKVSGALTTKANVVKQRLDALENGPAAAYLRWRLNDDLCFLREAWCRLDLLTKDREKSIEISFSRLLVWMGTSTIHPAVFQEELAASGETKGDRPSHGACQDRFPCRADVGERSGRVV